MITKLKKVKVLARDCAVCGRPLKISVPPNRRYTGGHYFGKTPFVSNAEYARVLKFGTHPSKIGKITVRVFNRAPKPYKFEEYWECDKCYNLPDTPLPARA